MATLTSNWGREPLDGLDDRVPTVALRYHLGRIHVGTSDLDVIRDVWPAIKQARAGKAEGFLWTRNIVKQTLAATLWLHRENQAEYHGVMTGRL